MNWGFTLKKFYSDNTCDSSSWLGKLNISVEPTRDLTCDSRESVCCTADVYAMKSVFPEFLVCLWCIWWLANRLDCLSASWWEASYTRDPSQVYLPSLSITTTWTHGSRGRKWEYLNVLCAFETSCGHLPFSGLKGLYCVWNLCIWRSN